jgi:GNAT superfamily N-acetyltransferase
MTVVRTMTADGLDALIEADTTRTWPRTARRFWRGCLSAQTKGAMTVATAYVDETVVGFGYLDRTSQNARFRAAGIPEIKDLHVAELYRRQGVATAIVAFLEDTARSGGSRRVGLGVGLNADYGSAQRLYARLGYIPDGCGVTWRNRPVRPRAFVRLNDDLLLWLVKDLEAKPPAEADFR